MDLVELADIAVMEFFKSCFLHEGGVLMKMVEPPDLGTFQRPFLSFIGIASILQST